MYMYMYTCRLHELCPLQGTEDTSNAICSLIKIKNTVKPLINAGAFIDFTCLPDPATIRDLRLLEACVY